MLERTDCHAYKTFNIAELSTGTECMLKKIVGQVAEEDVWGRERRSNTRLEKIP
jgi:hypothetical protein